MPQNITGLAWNLSSSIYHLGLKINLSSEFSGTPITASANAKSFVCLTQF